MVRKTGANHSWSLFCKEQRDQFAHGCSFVKRDESELLPLLSKKQRLSKEHWEQLSLGHKKGKSREKPSQIGFLSSETLIYDSDSLESRANHSCLSFLHSNESNLLMVTLLQRASGAIRTWLLKLKSNESKSLTVAHKYEQF